MIVQHSDALPCLQWHLAYQFTVSCDEEVRYTWSAGSSSPSSQSMLSWWPRDNGCVHVQRSTRAYAYACYSVRVLVHARSSENNFHKPHLVPRALGRGWGAGPAGPGRGYGSGIPYSVGTVRGTGYRARDTGDHVSPKVQTQRLWFSSVERSYLWNICPVA